MKAEEFISNRARIVDGSGIRKMSELSKNMIKPINLSVGQPDFDVPSNIIEAMYVAAKEGKNKYPPTQGVDKLRRKILEKKKIKNSDIDVVITPGATAAIFIALTTCFNEQDEILIADPYYVQYLEMLKILNIIPRIVDTYPDFKFNLEKIKKYITPKTKGIIINSPNNPTGVLLKNNELEEILQYAKTNNLVVIYDEIYKDFNFSKENLDLTDIYNNVIVINGFSKTYAMTGWRLGYAIANKVLVERMTRIQAQIYTSASSIIQYGAIEALDTDMTSFIDKYKERHKYVKNNLSKYYNISNSEGGFYFFVEVPKELNMNATEFCKYAITKNLVLIPGKVFSQYDTHFRFSICQDIEELKKAIDILKLIKEKENKYEK